MQKRSRKETNHMIKTIEIQDPGGSRVDIEYGGRLWIAEPSFTWGARTFRGKCPVCDDAKKITVRGYEMECPYCNSPRRNSAGSCSVTVRKYEAHEYIVNSFAVIGSETKKDFAPATWAPPRISRVSAFTRRGNGFGDIRTKEISLQKGLWDPSEGDGGWPGNMALRPEDYYWHRRKDAEAFCRTLNNAEREKLEKFNREHGTDHGYPFE